jgi:glutamine synthetase
MTPKEVLALCREKEIKVVDLRFTELPGQWQHVRIPVNRLNEDLFEDGLGFDGSNIRGWQTINEVDMLLVPQPETAVIDLLASSPTLSLICNIQDSITREDHSRDPRNVARKALNFLKSTGIADTAFFGLELDFFLFDQVRFDQRAQEGFYFIDSVEGDWNRGGHLDSTVSGPNLDYKLKPGDGGFPMPPVDKTMELRDDITQCLMDCGIEVAEQRHGEGAPGHASFTILFNHLVPQADSIMLFKYIVKNVAHNHGKAATFMPAPVFGKRCSAMHTSLSLWKGDEPLFAGGGYAGLSEQALYAMGGVLKHARAIMAFTNPTTNSYRRLIPGFDAPINLTYSQRNRTAACRVPMYSPCPRSKRIEFRLPDPSCNPYLALSAILMGAVDGILNKIDPGEPLDKDIYNVPTEEFAAIPKAPTTLKEALRDLQSDYDFLLRGDVFTSDLIDTWITHKRDELDELRIRPHPYEFCLYFDA